MFCCPSRRTQRWLYRRTRLAPMLREALFGVAAAALLLLFVGIHNAWDAVTYHVFVKKRGQQEAERRPSE